MDEAARAANEALHDATTEASAAMRRNDPSARVARDGERERERVAVGDAGPPTDAPRSS